MEKFVFKAGGRSRVRGCVCALLAALLAVTVAAIPSCTGSGADNSQNRAAAYASFRDVPGITSAEIEAIERLQASNSSFIYGMSYGSESFRSQSGEIRGFAALLCEYLTGFFGMSFKPAIYEWADLIAELDSNVIHFTGELTPDDNRRHNYQMTDAIAVRTVKYFRIRGGGSGPFRQIAAARPLRLGFLEGSATIANATSLGGRADYEAVFIKSHNQVYDMLKNGDIDAFLDKNPSEAFFDAYGDVVARDFLPLVYSPVSIATPNPRLRPIISVMQKALQAGIRSSLTELYNQGELEFSRHRLERSFSEAEREYVRKQPMIYFAAESNNYPISFYNEHEKQWQGIAFDALREVEKLTGLSFKVGHEPRVSWSNILKMLENGEVSTATTLIPTESRLGHFLWPRTALLQTSYALMSNLDIPNIKVNEILNKKIGLLDGTVHAELFDTWFPSHRNTITYDKTVTAFDALDRGEVDLIMGTESDLLTMTHYLERPGYKINLFFDGIHESFLGFNKNEELLCSVVDKALRQLDIVKIADEWKRKTYDYKAALAQSLLPWLISAYALGFLVIGLLGIMYMSGRTKGIKLEKMVMERTAELNEKTKLLEHLSMTDQLTGIPNRRCFDERLNLEWKVAAREKKHTSILIMDVDKFKVYNDTYGHQMGDVVLKMVATAVMSLVRRPNDLGARWGGEEFVVLLPNTDIFGALGVAEAIRSGIEKINIPMEDGSVTKVTISIGVNTLIPEPNTTTDAFLADADDALYKAKEMGRNRVYKSPSALDGAMPV